MRRVKIFSALFCIFLSIFARQVYGQGATEYTGKRVHLSSVKLVSESKKNLKVSLVLSNTGREDVRLYDGLNIETVVWTFGDSFKGFFEPYKERILHKLLQQNNTVIRAGQVFTPKSFKIKKLTKEDTTTVQPDLVSVEKPPNKEEKPKKQVKKPENEVVHTAQENNNKPSVKVRTMSPIGELPKPEASQECFDLVVDSVVIVKSTKKNLYLSFTLVNYGQGVFKFDRKNTNYENLSIKAFFASIPRLTRGALIVGGNHFDKLFEEKKFELGFGESIRGSMKVSLEKMTRFTPVVILELDPFSTVIECDKVNNVSTVLWKGN